MIELSSELVHVIDYVGCVHVYDIKGENETHFLFDVKIHSFIPIIDNEATNICLHEIDIDMAALGDEIVGMNSSVFNDFSV